MLPDFVAAHILFNVSGVRGECIQCLCEFALDEEVYESWNKLILNDPRIFLIHFDS